jgi:hypothetical protein
MTDVGRGYSGWADNAHRFYDLMLTGQPTERFWETLLKAEGSANCERTAGHPREEAAAKQAGPKHGCPTRQQPLKVLTGCHNCNQCSRYPVGQPEKDQLVRT